MAKRTMTQNDTARRFWARHDAAQASREGDTGDGFPAGLTPEQIGGTPAPWGEDHEVNT